MCGPIDTRLYILSDAFIVVLEGKKSGEQSFKHSQQLAQSCERMAFSSNASLDM